MSRAADEGVDWYGRNGIQIARWSAERGLPLDRYRTNLEVATKATSKTWLFSLGRNNESLDCREPREDGGHARVVGHDVRTCSTCFQAEQIAAAFKPDVVLLDIGLPDGNGLDLVPRLKPARIIAVSAYQSLEERQRSKAAGVDLHLRKPESRERILAFLEGMRSDADGTSQAGG